MVNERSGGIGGGKILDATRKKETNKKGIKESEERLELWKKLKNWRGKIEDNKEEEEEEERSIQRRR